MAKDILISSLFSVMFQINAVCAAQSNSFNVASNTGHPVRTLVPVSCALF